MPRRAALLLSVFVMLFVASRPATAQTVIVRSAPAGATIELTLNGGTPVTAKADGNGDATLAVGARSAESDVLLHVDSCGDLVRVLVVSRGLQPTPSAAGCTRASMVSVFIMRQATTFVVDVAGTDTAVHVSQGPPPIEWVSRDPNEQGGRKLLRGEPPKGLVLSAGAGFSSFSDAADIACGDTTNCRTSNLGAALSAGAEFWITKFAAVHVGYLRPADVSVSGSEDTFKFDSNLRARFLTIGGKAGVTVGAFRIYGLGGVNRHEATLTSSETINAKTITVNNATQTIPGGTQNFAQKTQDWNWMAGGGFEGWVNRWVAFYAEYDMLKVKGAPQGGGEGGIDDRATFFLGGLRLRIGR